MKTPILRRLRPATFTASEVEQITGVSGAMLRDWRRRDLIDAAPGRGWKRLATDELIQILVMRLLIKRNVRLSFAKEVGQKASGPIFYKLLSQAYPGEQIDPQALTSGVSHLHVLSDCPSEFGMIPAPAPSTEAEEIAWSFDPLKERYLVYAELENPSGESEYHMSLSWSIDDFRLDRVAEFLKNVSDPKISQKLFAILVLDLLDVFQELIDRRIKPYFVEVDE